MNQNVNVNMYKRSKESKRRLFKSVTKGRGYKYLIKQTVTFSPDKYMLEKVMFNLRKCRGRKEKLKWAHGISP